MTAHTQEATAKDGENQRNTEGRGFTLSEEERGYYISALQVSKKIVKGAGVEFGEVAQENLIGEVFRKIAQNLFWVRTEGIQEKRRAKVQEKATVKESCENGEHCERSPEPKPEPKGIGQRWKVEPEEEGEEEINEYEGGATIGDIVGETVKILNVEEVEGEFKDAREITVEGVGKIRTYSKVLGGQIQHLKDTGKLPAVGTIQERRSKNGRSYFNFSSSSFMGERDPRTKPIFEDTTKSLISCRENGTFSHTKDKEAEALIRRIKRERGTGSRGRGEDKRRDR